MQYQVTLSNKTGLNNYFIKRANRVLVFILLGKTFTTSFYRVKHGAIFQSVLVEQPYMQIGFICKNCTIVKYL